MTGRTGIGGNNPPSELEVQKPLVDAALETARMALTGVEVSTPEQEAAVSAVMKDLKAAKKSVTVAFEIDKRPIREAGDAVDLAKRRLWTALDTAIKTASDVLTPYRNRIATEKAERARFAAEAAAKAQTELEAAHRAKEGGDLEEAEELADKEKMAKDLRINAAKEKKPTATGLTTVLDVEIFNVLAACGYYLEDPRLKEGLLQIAQSDARGGKRNINGISIEERRVAL